jgi:hypothetical protein
MRDIDWTNLFVYIGIAGFNTLVWVLIILAVGWFL